MNGANPKKLPDLLMISDELNYDLPPTCIATEPAEPRDAARLMVIWRQTGRICHTRVCDLPRLADTVRPGDLLVFNQTRVLPAHFCARRAATGGRVQGLYLESPDALKWHVMLESRGRLQPGERIQFNNSSHLELLKPLGGGQWRAHLHSPLDTPSLLDSIGTLPLPTYIRKQRRARGKVEVRPDDVEKYNSVFATDPGSVAAPTAALHFTKRLLEQLQGEGVRSAALTLHIGLGTFAPVRTQRLEDHRMHSEWMSVPATTIQALRCTRRAGGRVIPVGTTCVRALESLPQPLPDAPEGFSTSTNLFIRPDDCDHHAFAFRFTDGLMTNFHLPKSTLLALVAALRGVGIERLKQWYQIAIDEGYRFYSYGDAMLLV